MAAQKNVFNARMAEDIDSRIASYFFRAVAPEDDFLRIEHTEPDFEAIEDVALDLGILKGRQWGGGNPGSSIFIGGDALRLKGPA